MDIPMSSIFRGNSIVVTSPEAPAIVGRKQCCSDGRHQQNSSRVTVLCICLVILTALFGVLLTLLFHRVKQIETIQNGIPSTLTIPKMDEVYMNESGTTRPPHMWRRDTHTQESETVRPFTTSSSLTNDASIVHVGGAKEEEYNAGEWISWMTDDSQLSIQHVPFVQDTYIIIPRPGFYSVYAQLTYNNRIASSYETGYEIIRQANCGHGTSQQLLKSYVTQVTNQTSKDSMYIGGVFYLYTNDRIGVRMITNGRQSFNIIPGQAALCFFGTHMVMSDPNYDGRIADTCCCLSNM